MANYVIARETPTGGPETPIGPGPAGTTDVNDPTSAEGIVAPDAYLRINLLACQMARPINTGIGADPWFLEVFDGSHYWFIGSNAGYATAAAADTALAALLP